MRLSHLAPLLVLLTPLPAHADTCEEVQHGCLENCHIDFGLAADRVKLTKCVGRCNRAFGNCTDLRQAQIQLRSEVGDQSEGKRRSDPDVRSYDDSDARDVRVRSADDDFDDGDRRRKPSRAKSRREREMDDDAPPPRAKVREVDDDAPPPPKAESRRREVDPEVESRREPDPDSEERAPPPPPPRPKEEERKPKAEKKKADPDQGPSDDDWAK